MLSTDLYEFLRANNFQGMSLSLVSRFALQLLVTLSFLKKNKIVHCDLKPENILLRTKNKTGIKLIDFGSGCFENEKIYTYIQSRYYRAPEIILDNDYSYPIDMWSLGCILCELCSGYPIFPGENEAEQIACIMEIKGLPPKSIIETSKKRQMFFDEGLSPKIYLNSKGQKRVPSSRDLASEIGCNNAQFLDFITCCLEWKPENRITPEDAFHHPWIIEALRNMRKSKDFMHHQSRSLNQGDTVLNSPHKDINNKHTANSSYIDPQNQQSQPYQALQIHEPFSLQQALSSERI